MPSNNHKMRFGLEVLHRAIFYTLFGMNARPEMDQSPTVCFASTWGLGFGSLEKRNLLFGASRTEFPFAAVSGVPSASGIFPHRPASGPVVRVSRGKYPCTR